MPRSKPLKKAFFIRDTVEVARDLIGKVLVYQKEGSEIAARILETEAYRGEDPAAHSYRGRTERSAPMFEAGGHAYIYFIYGMYEMLNFTTEPEGSPGAVLIRALEPLRWIKNGDRPHPKTLNPKLLDMSGPGKLTRALGITREDNRASLTGPKFRLFDDGIRPPLIAVTPRVGIRKGIEAPWRFYWFESPGISRVKENQQILAKIPHPSA